MDASAGKGRSRVIGGGDLAIVIARCGSSRTGRRPHLPALRDHRLGRRAKNFVARKIVHVLFFLIVLAKHARALQRGKNIEC